MPTSTSSSATTEAVQHAAEKVQDAPKTSSSSGNLLAQLRSFAAGGFGGVCAVVVGHPFDLVKVRLQTAERGVYSSAIDVVRKSVARDGLRRGLYAGVSAPLVGVTPMCRFFFSRVMLSTETAIPCSFDLFVCSLTNFKW